MMTWVQFFLDSIRDREKGGTDSNCHYLTKRLIFSKENLDLRFLFGSRDLIWSPNVSKLSLFSLSPSSGVLFFPPRFWLVPPRIFTSPLSLFSFLLPLSRLSFPNPFHPSSLSFSRFPNARAGITSCTNT